MTAQLLYEFFLLEPSDAKTVFPCHPARCRRVCHHPGPASGRGRRVPGNGPGRRPGAGPAEAALTSGSMYQLAVRLGTRPARGDGNLGQRGSSDMVRDADRALDGVAVTHNGRSLLVA